MVRAGFETIDPITGTKSVVLKGAREMGDRGWVIEVHCPEGAQPSILEHLHLTWTETFEIVSGTASYSLDGNVHTATAGQSVIMPPKLKHVHPWNSGTGTMVYRQTNDFGAVSPGAVDDVLGVFATINGLAREGKTGKRGLPKNPLQFAATLRTLIRYEGFDASVPISVQRVVAATVGRLAEAMGYRGVYSRYVE